MILYCEECRRDTEIKVVADRDAPDHEVGLTYRYTFGMCANCNNPFLAIQDDSICPLEDDQPLRLYPPLKKVDPSLPERVRAPFGEALTCIRSGAYTAAAMMCRKALEGLCVEHGHDGREDLHAKLKSMKDKGAIDGRLYEWSDELRLFGNEAAHNVDVVIDRHEAQDIVEFTRAILEYVFTFRDKFEEFKKRRADRKPKRPPPKVVQPVDDIPF